MENKQISRIAGTLIFIGIIVGVLSIIPSIENEKYIEIIYTDKTQIYIGALFQFLLIPIYICFALILYPILKQCNNILSIGFVGFRFMAGVFQLLGIILFFYRGQNMIHTKNDIKNNLTLINTYN